jgi:mRNA interferase RelE/StbE
VTPPAPPAPPPQHQWPIALTATAQAQLAAITDRRTQRAIAQTISRLAHAPDYQGKALVGDLAGYRSLRAAGQRYRILYTVERAHVVVYVVAVGLRKAGDKRDIYELARKLLRQGLLQPPPP